MDKIKPDLKRGTRSEERLAEANLKQSNTKIKPDLKRDTRSEERLAAANLKQKNTNISPDLKRGTRSEERLAEANKDKSDTNIGPNFKSKRARSDGGLRTSYEEPKEPTFGEAFKEARKAGKDKFTFNGKSYTTETAEEKEANKPTPTGNIGSRTMFDDGEESPSFKKGGSVKSKASSRADGCAKRGKTKGRMC